MTTPRTHIAVTLILACALAAGSGCGSNKKKDDSTPHMANRDGLHPTNEFEAKEGDPPFTADTRFAAGQIAETQNDAIRAIAQYREALKLDPNHQPSLYRLAALYTQQQRFVEAEAVWLRYIKATKGAPAGYNNLGFCYEMGGNLEEAEKAFKTCIDRDPDDPTCRVNYGLMLARHGRTDEAIAQLGTVLTPAEVHYNLGSVCEQQGHKEEAKAYYRKALELDPKLHDAKARLAQLP